MTVHYISPSALPSRAANAVHVTLQCDALAGLGADVTLYARRTVDPPDRLVPALQEEYGVDASRWRLVTFYSRSPRAVNLRIAAVALRALRGQRNASVLSRNLYASYVLGVIERRPLLFETHQLEWGVRKRMQRAIMSRPWVTTVAISQALVACLAEHHGAPPRRVVVLHDAAPTGLPAPAIGRRNRLADLVGAPGEWAATCGYFGHLYPGRGIDIVEAMARARPKVLFLIFGGNDADIAARRQAHDLPNVRFAGHVPHAAARARMAAADVLLMPYQASVSIGVAGHDTARWMSPLKMFEYLASGAPVLASDLPPLREVLDHERNALLVDPGDAGAWIAALDRLIADTDLARGLADRAYADYRERHTWQHRAERLLALLRP